MNYADIKYPDVANGPGIRVSLFVSGCEHYCKGCFNSEAWDFNYGQPFNNETWRAIVDLLNKPFVNGLSILGGEPLHPSNQQEIYSIIENTRFVYDQLKSIWVYTGYTYEDIVSGKVGDTAKRILEKIDVLVDGKFEIDKRDLTLAFRGSSNQRVINVPLSLHENKIVLKCL